MNDYISKVRDFTFETYSNYLQAIQQQDIPFVLFRDFFRQPETSSFCLLRHDVDRWPGRSLNMARMESEMGVKSTYYFRIKRNTLKPEIIKEIEALGHEIGYHYESLSDSNGDISLAIKDFEKNLDILRRYAKIDTCAMHGRPLSPYDNRDLWESPKGKHIFKQRFHLLGEVYLDIDYKDILYINDTGRNWASAKANFRDKVVSDITKDFENGEMLYDYLINNPHRKICLQIHPERWSNNFREHAMSHTMDIVVNNIKRIVELRRQLV